MGASGGSSTMRNRLVGWWAEGSTLSTTQSDNPLTRVKAHSVTGRKPADQPISSETVTQGEKPLAHVPPGAGQWAT